MKIKLARRLGQNPRNTVLDLSAQEAQLLLRQGHATPVAEKAKEAPETALMRLSPAELRGMAEERGLALYGSREQLAQRIVKHDAPTKKG